ncbi:MAG: polysaccharide biosynthesis tyrosine autokinase, partial [Candidatus Binatia bacterium]
ATELRASNISIIDKAEPPRKPSRPKKGMNLLLSVLVGLMGGVGLAFFLEHLDKTINTLKTPQEVQRYLRVPNLGLVPDFLSLRHAPQKDGLGVLSQRFAPDSNLPAPGKELVVSHHPLSVVTEAYRRLRTAIMLSRAGEPPKTILFTSGRHREGKTATVVNTAIIFAQMGVKVLVMDADLRRPSCHRVLGIGNRLGLTDVLTGQRDMEHVIKPTAMNNLFLLSGGLTPPNPTELVGSKKMHETLTSLQEHYDYILIDSPPVMPVSDAVLLSTMVDGMVLVVNGQVTPKHVVKVALSHLASGQGKILGVLLNRVDMRSEDYTDYFYSYYPTGADQAK